jgi:hypothetical protein
MATAGKKMIHPAPVPGYAAGGGGFSKNVD